MATKKKPSAAQLAARKKFVEMVRAKSKAKKSTTKKAKPSASKKEATHKDTKSHNVNIKVVSGTKTNTMSKRIKVTPLTEKELSKIGWNIFRHSGGAYFIASPLKEGISFTALSKLTLRKKASEFLAKSIIK